MCYPTQLETDHFVSTCLCTTQIGVELLLSQLLLVAVPLDIAAPPLTRLLAPHCLVEPESLEQSGCAANSTVPYRMELGATLGSGGAVFSAQLQRQQKALQEQQSSAQQRNRELLQRIDQTVSFVQVRAQNRERQPHLPNPPFLNRLCACDPLNLASSSVLSFAMCLVGVGVSRVL